MTRRALVAAGAGALLAGCGREEPAAEREADVLSRVLAIELALVEAHSALDGGEATEHRDHVTALERAIREAGGARAPRPAAVPSGDPTEAALELERRAMAACVDAFGRVSRGPRRATLAELLSADAAHAALLLDALGRDPLERAFADGRPA